MNCNKPELVCIKKALVKWLWEETCVTKVVGLNTGDEYCMDMTFFHIDLL